MSQIISRAQAAFAVPRWRLPVFGTLLREKASDCTPEAQPLQRTLVRTAARIWRCRELDGSFGSCQSVTRRAPAERGRRRGRISAATRWALAGGAYTLHISYKISVMVFKLFAGGHGAAPAVVLSSRASPSFITPPPFSAPAFTASQQLQHISSHFE